MKLDDQLRLARWVLAQGEAYKARALELPSSRAHYGERMKWQGAAWACFEICKEVLADDFNEQLEKRDEQRDNPEAEVL